MSAAAGHLPRRGPVDDSAERFSRDEEEHAEQREQEDERVLTQRELVRASLLRCPPPALADPPRR